MKEGTSIVNTEEYRELLKMKEDLQNECDEVRVGRTYVLTKKGLAEYVEDRLEQMEQLLSDNERVMDSISNVDDGRPHPMQFFWEFLILGLLSVVAVKTYNIFSTLTNVLVFFCGIVAMKLINTLIAEYR